MKYFFSFFSLFIFLALPSQLDAMDMDAVDVGAPETYVKIHQIKKLLPERSIEDSIQELDEIDLSNNHIEDIEQERLEAAGLYVILEFPEKAKRILDLTIHAGLPVADEPFNVEFPYMVDSLLFAHVSSCMNQEEINTRLTILNDRLPSPCDFETTLKLATFNRMYLRPDDADRCWSHRPQAENPADPVEALYFQTHHILLWEQYMREYNKLGFLWEDLCQVLYPEILEDKESIFNLVDANSFLDHRLAFLSTIVERVELWKTSRFIQETKNLLPHGIDQG